MTTPVAAKEPPAVSHTYIGYHRSLTTLMRQFSRWFTSNTNFSFAEEAAVKVDLRVLWITRLGQWQLIATLTDSCETCLPNTHLLERLNQPQPESKS